MPNNPDAFIPTRASLIGRLKDVDDQTSWQDFYDTYRRLIFSAAIKAGLNEQEAEDVVQETVVTVAKTMPEFRYDPSICSFKTWLLRLTRFRIVDQLRRRPPVGKFESIHSIGSEQSPAVNQLPDPAGLDLDAIWDEEWKNDLLAKAVQKVRNQVNAEQFQIFDFYVLHKWSVLEVAKRLNVNVGQVYLAKHRISKMIKQEIQALEVEVMKPKWPIGRRGSSRPR